MAKKDLEKQEYEYFHTGEYCEICNEELTKDDLEYIKRFGGRKICAECRRKIEQNEKDQFFSIYFLCYEVIIMERNKEERVWCLSKTEGWVKISDWNYTDEEPDVYRQKPNDTVLVLTCYSAGSKPCPNTCESEKLGEDDEIMAAKEKFGNMPDHPYM